LNEKKTSRWRVWKEGTLSALIPWGDWQKNKEKTGQNACIEGPNHLPVIIEFPSKPANRKLYSGDSWGDGTGSLWSGAHYRCGQSLLGIEDRSWAGGKSRKSLYINTERLYHPKGITTRGQK